MMLLARDPENSTGSVMIRIQHFCKLLNPKAWTLDPKLLETLRSLNAAPSTASICFDFR